MKELVLSIWLSRILTLIIFFMGVAGALALFLFWQISYGALIFLFVPVARNGILAFSQENFAGGKNLKLASVSTIIFLFLTGIFLFLFK